VQVDVGLAGQHPAQGHAVEVDELQVTLMNGPASASLR
jgi:hypothetical protein